MAEPEKKEYPISVVLTLVTGIMLDEEFDEAHGCAAFLLGHEIFTHEMAEKAVWDRLHRILVEQHPALRDAESWAPPTELAADRARFRLYLNDYLKRARAKFGATLLLSRGHGQRTESPMESLKRLAPGKPIIGIVMPEREPSSSGEKDKP